MINQTQKKTRVEYFSHWYKWVVMGSLSPESISGLRYDADMVLITNEIAAQHGDLSGENKVFIEDVFVHPRDGISLFSWAYWIKDDGLHVTDDRQKILRRLDLKQYPLRIAAPMGYYSKNVYHGTFKDYVEDISTPERDPGIRCAYGVSALIVESLKATEVLIGTQLWSAEVNNNSMLLMLSQGRAELGGGVLRILPGRITRLDYAMCIWPFRVGFTYVSERESTSNMFLEPFALDVWWSCLALVAVLALAQRLMAKLPEEKECAYITVLATYLQQDASAVPEGLSGRLTFIVLSISSMLVHAYYTSAIVSAFMSTGKNGPDSLTSLADSKYAISSEDYDYMRYLMFDVETNRDDLEYLKKKKKTSKFYQGIERGVQLIQDGNTAYHTEYNQLYPRMKLFTDDQICKLQYVDTIPETVTWVTTTKRGQWIEVFRSTGRWLHETGLARRLVSRLRIQPPHCRAALLAERVKFQDVVPVILLSVLGVILSFIQLGAEILFSNWNNRKNTKPLKKSDTDNSSIEEEIIVDTGNPSLITFLE